jgi:hypothetical protein
MHTDVALRIGPIRAYPRLISSVSADVSLRAARGMNSYFSSMSHPLHEFAAQYTEAWCSQQPSRVAAFYALDGVLTINGGPPHMGREAITASAASFMSAFPDLLVALEGLEERDGRVWYHWLLTGTNTGPGGTGRAVRIRGSEAWLMHETGLIADSIGAFDVAEYERQLRA